MIIYRIADIGVFTLSTSHPDLEKHCGKQSEIDSMAKKTLAARLYFIKPGTNWYIQFTYKIEENYVTICESGRITNTDETPA
jgi:hypothetical protein